MKKDGKGLFSTTPSEIFISCGNNIYNIIAIPRRIPSQTVRLLPGDKSKNNLLFASEVPFEKKVVGIVKKIYMGNIPESITEKKIDKSFPVFQGIDLVLNKIYIIDQENLRVKEYRATISTSANIASVYLKEKDFLKSELASKPVGVSIDVLNLKKGGMSRIFIVEKYDGGSLS
jgi:conjugal transfer pilus assembly protein TraK